jgi:hypothetical protein
VTRADAAADDLIQKFSAAVGELILWANSVDHQLNKALMLMLVLPEHAFIEPIVAQLDARVKAELLKKRAQFLPEKNEWRTSIVKWVKRAEKVQANRNVVAHHQVRFVGDKPVLFSAQLGKLFDTITAEIKPAPARGLPEILSWIEQAKTTFEEGENVIVNLKAFADIALRQQNKKDPLPKD